MFLPARIRPDPLHMLWHVAMGAMPGFLDEKYDAVGWLKLSARGVQMLDKLIIPKKQRPYVFSPKWDIRIDNAFEEVVRACSDTARMTIQKRSGRTWITETLIRGLLRLHALGYAHSYEAWEDGRLAGGVWGFQLGSFVSMNSMFHYVSNASKAAFARGQMILRDNGFTMVDMNGVPDHLVNFGIEWMPQWKFDMTVAGMINSPRPIAPGIKAPPTPWAIRVGVPAARILAGVARRVRGGRQ